jgi:hypothetical protein
VDEIIVSLPLRAVKLLQDPDMRNDAESIVCTLAEGSYFQGAAALANSLVYAGFQGTVVVGYRGVPPQWLETLPPDGMPGVYTLTPHVRLQLVEVPGAWHLNNRKAHFINSVLKNFADAETFYYFDTDIVITRHWNTFINWARKGVVLALDIADTYMSPHHVYRQAWRDLSVKRGFACRDVTGYVNGGCVGMTKAHAGFAEVWSSLMEELERDGADMQKMKNWDGPLEFSRMDQDVLNATVMATDTPIALLGSEAMGMFPWAGVVMPHAMFQKKPWLRNYIIDALRGFPPDRTHLAYWQFVNGPIYPFGRSARRLKQLQLKIARLIGLLHSRSLRDL